jgi:glutaminase
MEYNQILEEIQLELTSYKGLGKLPDYIPELAQVDSDKFGCPIVTVEHKKHQIGDVLQKFSIQSISKVFTLAMALSFEGKDLWQRVGVEPSGSAFNSIVQLEYEKGIPRNPFINAGALVIADVLLSRINNPKAKLLEFINMLAGGSHIDINIDVYVSEKNTSAMNTSLAHMLKAYGNINNDINAVLDFYFFQCAIEMSCEELSFALLPFADHTTCFNYAGISLSASRVKRINAIMLTCGFYDESGEFSFKVGLPGKSGVGGGIVAVHPNKYSVAAWSPLLNEKGNSVMGMKALELLTTKTGLSVF